MNLAVVMEERAAAGGWSHRPAFLVGDQAFTHAEVHDGAARAASFLAGLGVRRGDRVLVALADGVEFAWAFLGAARLGAIAVPVNPRLTAGDHRHMVADADARVVVCGSELLDRFPERSAVTTCELAAAVDSGAPCGGIGVEAADPAYAQYTSGTTGLPRAALHRHSDPLVYAEAFAQGAIHMGPDDIVVSVSKMYFAYGLGNSLLFPLLLGACAVLNPGLALPAEVARLVERHGATILFAVPTFYARLASGAPSGCFRSLRVAVSAGETLTVVLARRTAERLNCPVLDGLGSTEVGQTFVSNTLASVREGTVGRPLPPYEVTVRDGAGAALPPGQTGTLWVRGPTLLTGYLGQAAGVVDDHGWLCTGDRGELDADGFVRLHGRADDIEMVGGISVAPFEIEQLLSTHPAVSEVAVAGVRDGEGASRLEAFVVVAPGEGTEALPGELISSARRHLAPHKVPQAVHVVPALPRTPTGKLRRFVLRQGWTP